MQVRGGVCPAVEALPAADVPAGLLGPGRKPRRPASLAARRFTRGKPFDHQLPRADRLLPAQPVHLLRPLQHDG